MVSRNRKKNKGKERKAKKEAERMEAERLVSRQLWWGWAIGEKQLVGRTITCDHGYGELPNNLDHPVASFMDAFISGWHNGAASCSVFELITPLLKAHPQVGNDESYKNEVVDIMTSMGTNMLLNRGDACIKGALNLARSIVILENCGTGSYYVTSNSRVVQTRVRDLHTNVISSERDALKFYSKRIPCSCLKKMHQEVRRAIPKTGKCFGCQKEKERVKLSVCSRCMVMQFCSRECQVANWHKHERDCDILVNAHKERLGDNNTIEDTTDESYFSIHSL